MRITDARTNRREMMLLGLALTAGKAVRITLDVPKIEPDERDELVHHLTPRALIADAVDNQRLFYYLVDRHARVQGTERIL